MKISVIFIRVNSTDWYISKYVNISRVTTVNTVTATSIYNDIFCYFGCIKSSVYSTSLGKTLRTNQVIENQISLCVILALYYFVINSLFLFLYYSNNTLDISICMYPYVYMFRTTDILLIFYWYISDLFSSNIYWYYWYIQKPNISVIYQ